jgi:hypothetical protein
MTDEERKKIAAEVAKLIPNEAVLSIIGDALVRSLQSLTWSTDEIAKIVHAAIIEKAKELLKTQYSEQVASQAQLLAAQMVGELARMKLQERR